MDPYCALRKQILAGQTPPGPRARRAKAPTGRGVLSGWVRRLALKVMLSLGLIIVSREYLQSEHGQQMQARAIAEVTRIVHEEMAARRAAAAQQGGAAALPGAPAEISVRLDGTARADLPQVGVPIR